MTLSAATQWFVYLDGSISLYISQNIHPLRSHHIRQTDVVRYRKKILLLVVLGCMVELMGFLLKSSIAGGTSLPYYLIRDRTRSFWKITSFFGSRYRRLGLKSTELVGQIKNTNKCDSCYWAQGVIFWFLLWVYFQFDKIFNTYPDFLSEFLKTKYSFMNVSDNWWKMCKLSI